MSSRVMSRFTGHQQRHPAAPTSHRPASPRRPTLRSSDLSAPVLCQHCVSRLCDDTATTAYPRRSAASRTRISSGRPRQCMQRPDLGQKSLPEWLQPCATNSTPMGAGGSSHSTSRSLMFCKRGGGAGGELSGRRQQRRQQRRQHVRALQARCPRSGVPHPLHSRMAEQPAPCLACSLGQGLVASATPSM